MAVALEGGKGLGKEIKAESHPDTPEAQTKTSDPQNSSSQTGGDQEFRFVSSHDGLLYGGEIAGPAELSQERASLTPDQGVLELRSKKWQLEKLLDLPISHGHEYGPDARTIDPQTIVPRILEPLRTTVSALALSEDRATCSEAVFTLKKEVKSKGTLPVEVRQMLEHTIRVSNFEDAVKGCIDVLKECGQAAGASRPTLLWRIKDSSSSFEIAKEAAGALATVYPDLAWRDFESIINNASAYNPDSIEAALHGLDELSKNGTERAEKLSRGILTLARASINSAGANRIDLALAVTTACQLGGKAACSELLEVLKIIVPNKNGSAQGGTGASLSRVRSDAVKTALNHLAAHGERDLLPGLRQLRSFGDLDAKLSELLSSTIDAITKRAPLPTRWASAVRDTLSS